MSFGRPSFIATRLLGGDLARRVHKVRSESAYHGSTTGPWPGISGTAVTAFQITEFLLEDGVALYFADARFLGWSESPDVREDFPRLRATMAGLDGDPATCPFALPDFASVRYDDAQARIAASLSMGVLAEGDNPALEAIVSTITPEQVEWIAAWLAGEGIS